jgi:hypothetical protein
MVKSFYSQWVDKYFKGIVIKKVETMNGKPNEQASTYMFKEMLRKEYSPYGKWESISAMNTRVSADLVSMDSSLPLKMRDSIRKASGNIVKSGMKLWLNENQITQINELARNPNIQEGVYVSKIFQDVPRVIVGIYELMENLFLQGLSSGVALFDGNSENGTGLGVRIDYGYLPENKFGVSQLWSNPSAMPLDDIAAVLKKAKNQDGNTITDVYMDDVTFDSFVKTQQVKEFYAVYIGWQQNAAQIPYITTERMNTALKADNRYRFAIHIVDRTVTVEKNGARKTLTPWSEGKVIFTTSKEVGVLTYAHLGEQESPVDGVSYQTADDYILVSKYRENDPLAEFTTSQARVVPVICNVEQIYQIDANTLVA